MNKAALSYRPSGDNGGSGVVQKRIDSKARSSAARAESYRFKSRSAPPGGGGIESLLSVELKERAALKYEALLKREEHSQWTDRIYGSLAAPMGSELFLESEWSASVLGAPRFYHTELSTALEDENGRSVPTAALPRFAYSDDAHRAAKKVQGKMAKYLLRRNYAATILQRAYLVHITMKRFRIEVKAKHEAARKIQWFFRKRYIYFVNC